jgi:hypothetical protein
LIIVSECSSGVAVLNMDTSLIEVWHASNQLGAELSLNLKMVADDLGHILVSDFTNPLLQIGVPKGLFVLSR